MNKEDREAANAALLLDQKIEERIWEAIEKDPVRLERVLINAIDVGKYTRLGGLIAEVANLHLRGGGTHRLYKAPTSNETTPFNY